MTATLTPPRENGATLPVYGPFCAGRWGLIVTGEASYAEWEEAGRRLQEAQEAFSWALCDWLAWGESHYGEDYAQALDNYTFSEGYVANLQTLFRAFPPERRRWVLGKSYYQAVLPLTREAQERVLDMVVEDRLTRDELRAAVRALPEDDRRRPRPVPRFQVATLPAPCCSKCGGALVRLASGAHGCLVCEDVCPDCGDLRYGPDAPHVCRVPSGNGHNAPETDEAVLTAVFTRHERNEWLEDEPVYTPPARPVGQVAVVETCYGRQVVLRFEAAPNLKEGQRVRVTVEGA